MPIPSSEVHQIKALIAGDRLEDAFQWFQEANLDPIDQETLSILQGRYNGLKRDRSKGIISEPDARLEKNQIRDGLLQLTARWYAEAKEGKPTRPSDQPNSIPWLQVIFLLTLVFATTLFYTYQFYSEPWDAYRGTISLFSQIFLGLGGVFGVVFLIIWGSKDTAQNKLIGLARKLAMRPLVLISGIVLLGTITFAFAIQLLTTTQMEVYANERMDLYLLQGHDHESARLGELPKEKSQKYRLPVGMNHLLGLSKPERDTLFQEQNVYVDMWGKEGPIPIAVIEPEPELPVAEEPAIEEVLPENTPVAKTPQAARPTIQQESHGANSPNVVVEDGDATFNFPAADLSPPAAKDTTRKDTLTP